MDAAGASGADSANGTSVPVLRCGRFRLTLDRPLVMAVVNVTADSFSDGGRHLESAAAVDAARRFVAEGADIVDIGAESTRPGAEPVSADLEWQRLRPVLQGLADLAVPISVDTRRAEVMEQAIAAGAAIINDVGGFADRRAIAAVSAPGLAPVGVIAMHMQGDPRTMQAAPFYADVVAEVTAFLAARRAALIDAGVAADRIVVDPGFGFGKSLEHNLALLAALPRLATIAPVLAGLSRKSMLGRLTGQPVDRRLGASIAAAIAAVERGAAIVRVHDVAETVAALAVWRAVGVSRWC
ncbi:MAG: dihydropteroate synthase [Burkholderiaceae bacterium]